MMVSLCGLAGLGFGVEFRVALDPGPSLFNPTNPIPLQMNYSLKS